MNRADRRKIEKGKISTQYTTEYKQAHVDINKLIETIKQSAMKEALTVIMSSMAISLHDEYNFKQKRIQKVIERIRNQLECVTAKTITAKELLGWCNDMKIKLL